MAMHVCNQTKNTSWKDLQKQITGLWNTSNKYMYRCGACLKTFETICTLHCHCMKSNRGGSYFFDHVTNTAYPKFDVTSSWSQFEEEDFVNDSLPVLKCHSRSINQLINNSQDGIKINDISSEIDDSDDVTNFKDEVGKHVTASDSAKPTQDGMHIDEENINLEEAGDKNVNKSEEACATFKMKEDGTGFVDVATSDLYHQASLTPQADKNVIHVMPHSVKKIALAKPTGLQLLEMENTAEIPEARTVGINSGDKHDQTNGKDNSYRKLAQHETNEEWHKSILEGKSNDVKGKERKQTKACVTNKQMSSPLDDVINTSSIRSSRKRKITSKMKDSGYAGIMSNIRKEISLDDEVQNTEISNEESFDKNEYSSTVKGNNNRTAKESKIKLKHSRDKDIELTDSKKRNKKHISKQSSKTGSSDASIDMSDSESRKVKCFSQGESPVFDHEECSNVKEKIYNENESKDNTNNFKKKNRPRNTQNKKKRCSRKQDDNFVPCKLRKDFECKVCGKVGSKSTIKYHEQVHSEKLLECEICGKLLKTAVCKASHIKLHGKKKWQCDRCPAAFYRKQALDSHLNKHDAIMPHMCDLCGAKFTESYILRRHVANFHNNIRDFSCDICEKKFYRALTRDNHRKRHFEASLQCSQCPKRFKIENDLRRHEFTHSKEKQFFCPLCNQGFKQSYTYNKHMWRIHNIGKEQAKEVKIKNPNIVNWQVKNSNSSQEDKSTNVKDQSVNGDIGKKQLEGVCNQSKSDAEKQSTSNAESNQTMENNEIIAEINDFTDTIVLQLGDKIDGQDTIVIHTKDIHSIDNQSGYIVLDDLQSGGDIVIYSEYAENEIADANEYQENS